MLGSLLRLAAMYGLGSYYSYPTTIDFGSFIDLHQINRARRKIHRAKMYRRFRNQRLRGMRKVRV